MHPVRGFALAIALVLLLIVSILGLGAISAATTDLALEGNEGARQIAALAAEWRVWKRHSRKAPLH